MSYCLTVPAWSGLVIIPLEDFDASAGMPRAVTRDGKVVVGHGPSGSSEATLIWDTFGQVRSIGPGVLYDVNDSASVFVGQTIEGRPAKWSNAVNSIQLLNSFEQGVAHTVTASGATSFGAEIPAIYNFRATKFSHQILEVEELAPIFSRVNECSADGSTLVGEATFDNQTKAFRKVGTDPLEDLGLLNGGSSVAQDVSDDGKVVVGVSSFRFFIWTEKDGMVDLEVAHNGTFSDNDISVSGDGNVVVGASGPNCFSWDEIHGVRNLMSTLQEGGLDLAGWELDTVLATSYDGNVLVGVGRFGVNPEPKAWMVKGFSTFLPPKIRIEELGTGFVVKFSGILQQSSDLGLTDPWTDVPGSPVSEYIIPSPTGNRRFFRARSN